MKLEPDQQEAIIAAGLAIVGLIGVFTGDKHDRANDSQLAKTEQLQAIELQSRRLDREQTDSGNSAGADAGAAVSSGNHPANSTDRVRSAMQSQVESSSKRNYFTEGFNDR